MLASYTVDLDEFKRENDLTERLDDEIAQTLEKLKRLLNERLSLNDHAPDHYYDLQDCMGDIEPDDRAEVFTPNMVRQANATRQTRSPTGGINKARYARAFIVNLSDNGFNVSTIKLAIAEALNVIVNEADYFFSINDIENCIKDLRKKGVICKQDAGADGPEPKPLVTLFGDKPAPDGVDERDIIRYVIVE